MRREAHKPTGPVVSTKKTPQNLLQLFFACNLFMRDRNHGGWMVGRSRWSCRGRWSGGRWTQPVSSTWAANSYQATISFRAQNLFYGKKSIYYSYKKISLCVYIACWTIKVTIQYLKHSFFYWILKVRGSANFVICHFSSSSTLDQKNLQVHIGSVEHASPHWTSRTCKSIFDQ